MLNGDSRRNMLSMMFILVFLIFTGSGYLLYYAIQNQHVELEIELLDFIKTGAILVIGLFVAIGRELFQVNKTPPIVLYKDNEGNIKQMELIK